MGLTGHILEVSFRMARVPSCWILQETEQLPNLDRLLDGLSAAAEGWPMTMAWIDCLTPGRRWGAASCIADAGRRRTKRPADRRVRSCACECRSICRAG